MKKLIIIAGPPRSGKSTIARKLVIGKPAGFGILNFNNIKMDLKKLARSEFEESTVIIEEVMPWQLNDVLDLIEVSQLLRYRNLILVSAGDIEFKEITNAYKIKDLTIQVIETMLVDTNDITPK